MHKITFALFLGLFIIASPISAHAATKVAGWIPWWHVESGTLRAQDQIRDLDTIYPFVFEVDEVGELVEKADLSDREWRDLFRKARQRDVEILPTIAWFDGEAIDRVLSDARLRKKHIERIVDMVDDGNYDGVNIDYESKLARTQDDYSRFLKELQRALGRDLLTCTLESRTPPASRWREVPEVIEYANDFVAIDRYCDRIEIMAYDQQRIDWRLNTDRKGEPYIPVADVAWVEKVLELALEDIDEDKIMLGVPTYGREWELVIEPEWFKEYRTVGALNMPDALEIADEYSKQPGRNRAGELSFTYFPENSVFKLLEQLPTPAGTRTGFEAAAKALLFANATGMSVPVRVVWFSDARAIEDKLELVEKYDLRGIALFKIDGHEDSEIWDLF